MIRELDRKLIGNNGSLFILQITFRWRSKREILSFGTYDKHHPASSPIRLRWRCDRDLIHIRRNRGNGLTLQCRKQCIPEITKSDRKISEFSRHSIQRFVRIVIRKSQSERGLLVSRLLPLIDQIFDMLSLIKDHIVKCICPFLTCFCFFYTSDLIRCLKEDRKDLLYDLFFRDCRHILITGKHLLFIPDPMRQAEILEALNRLRIDCNKSRFQIRHDRWNIPAERRNIQNRCQILHPDGSHQRLLLINKCIQPVSGESSMKTGTIFLQVTHDNCNITIAKAFKLNRLFNTRSDIFQFIRYLMKHLDLHRKIQILSFPAGTDRIIRGQNRK